MQSALTWFHLAATYGSNSFGSNPYSTAVQLGPVTLPDTGAAMAVGGAVLVALAGGIAVWILNHRKHTANE